MRILTIDPNKWKMSYALTIKRDPKSISWGTDTVGSVGEFIYGMKLNNRKGSPNRIELRSSINNRPSLTELWSEWICGFTPTPDLLVIEKPDHAKTFPGDKGINQKVRGLADLSVVIGAIVGTCHLYPGGSIETIVVEPREWKGNKKKDKMVEEIIRPWVLSFRGNVAELASHPPTEDEWDAIGLMRWVFESGVL